MSLPRAVDDAEQDTEGKHVPVARGARSILSPSKERRGWSPDVRFPPVPVYTSQISIALASDVIGSFFGPYSWAT